MAAIRREETFTDDAWNEDDLDATATSSMLGELDISPTLNTYNGSFRTKSDSSVLSCYQQEPNYVQAECGWVTTMNTRYGLL
jgi:hypothetical protein